MMWCEIDEPRLRPPQTSGATTPAPHHLAPGARSCPARSQGSKGGGLETRDPILGAICAATPSGNVKMASVRATNPDLTQQAANAGWRCTVDLHHNDQAGLLGRARGEGDHAGGEGEGREGPADRSPSSFCAEWHASPADHGSRAAIGSRGPSTEFFRKHRPPVICYPPPRYATHATCAKGGVDGSFLDGHRGARRGVVWL